MKESAPEIFAISALTTLQFFNLVLTPIFVYELISNNRVIDKTVIIVSISIIFAFNIYRYNKIINFNHLAEKWNNNEEKNNRNKIDILIIIFIVISVIIVIGLAILLGGINLEKIR